MSVKTATIAFSRPDGEQNADITGYRVRIVPEGTPFDEASAADITGEYDANGGAEVTIDKASAGKSLDGKYTVYVTNIDDVEWESEPDSLVIEVDFVRPDKPVGLRLV